MSPSSSGDPDAVSSLRARLVGASVAAAVAAVVVNPLDVIKTQTQANHAYAAGATNSGAYAAVDCPPRCPTTGNAQRMCAPECARPTRTLDVAKTIFRREGARGFWRGTSGALAAAFPTVGIYLPCYDYALEWLISERSMSEGSAAAVAGAGSRTAATLCVAPLELARTRVLATGRGTGGIYGESGGRAFVGALRQSASVVGNGPSGYLSAVRSAWTGVGPTLARDVPYSAMYWYAVEKCRTYLGGDVAGRREARTVQELAGINFASGVIAGAVVAAITTPLDVVKTRVQIRDIHPTNFASSTESAPGISRRGVVSELIAVARIGGASALFAGWGPRAARAAPTGAIVLVSYEVVRTQFS